MHPHDTIPAPLTFTAHTFTCAHCGKTFVDPRHTKRTYCSTSCSTEVNRHRPVTEETRRRIGASHEGLRHTDEAKAKMRQAKLGRPLPQMHKEYIGLAHRSVPVREETRRKIVEGIRQANLTEATRARRRAAGLRISDEHRRILSELRKGNTLWLGRHHSEATKEKLREAALARLANPDYSARWHAAVHRGTTLRPTLPERLVGTLLDEMGLPGWCYVGDATVLIGGRSPDFVRFGARPRVIEVYGDYWHRNDDPDERIGYFAAFGFEALIVWEHELYEDTEAVARRLEAFSV